jgi:hypothetical protein
LISFVWFGDTSKVDTAAKHSNFEVEANEIVFGPQKNYKINESKP